jgi:hypothetical protein
VTIKILESTPWARHHDPRARPIRPSVARIICFDKLEDLISICASRPASTRFKGSGSHWGLSEAALSDHDAIETNWPGPDPEPIPRYSGLDLDLIHLHSEPLFHFLVAHPPGKAELLTSDPCLQRPASGPFLVHIKAGTRVYETYSLLDQAGAKPGTLAAHLNAALAGTPAAGAYDGPWAFATLGGAGGQTVFGALTTGTHGGDYRQQPISDSVVALHLVTDGGAHYWIEPNRNELPIADDEKLRRHYGNIAGAHFDIIRDNAIFDATVISGGRFGIIASLVLRVVPQYCLHEHRVLEAWSEVKLLLNGPQRHHAFDPVYFPASGRTAAQADFVRRFGSFAGTANRFLQIAVNTCPHNNDEHRVGVTQRWFAAHSSPEAKNPDGSMRGRNERGTPATAGKTFPYEPTEDPSKSGSSSGTFLQKACANGNFIAGVLREAADAVQEIIDEGFVPATSIVALASGFGPAGLINPITDICLILKLIVEILRALADDVEASGDVSLTQVVNATIESIMNNPDIPRPVAIMTIRMIFLMIFESQQSKRDYVALSYAVMDTHDYKDRSCFGNAESIEVFFDARRPDVYCTYVDQILAFEAAQQENEGRFTAGYVSLRYVQGSNGLIAPSRFDETLVIEVAAIRDAAGSVPFVMNAAQVARHPMFAAPFHWGQFNPLVRAEVDRIFNGPPKPAALTMWREALRRFTENGRRNGFSSAFTRRAGLEL